MISTYLRRVWSAAWLRVDAAGRTGVYWACEHYSWQLAFFGLLPFMLGQAQPTTLLQTCRSITSSLKTGHLYSEGRGREGRDWGRPNKTKQRKKEIGNGECLSVICPHPFPLVSYIWVDYLRDIEEWFDSKNKFGTLISMSEEEGKVQGLKFKVWSRFRETKQGRHNLLSYCSTSGIRTFKWSPNVKTQAQNQSLTQGKWSEMGLAKRLKAMAGGTSVSKNTRGMQIPTSHSLMEMFTQITGKIYSCCCWMGCLAVGEPESESVAGGLEIRDRVPVGSMQEPGYSPESQVPMLGFMEQITLAY